MNILVTRPDERGQALVESLNQAGIFALHQPLFQFESGRELPILPTVFKHLSAGDAVIAVSKIAVDFATETLAQTGFHFRSDLQYFAVGQQTAAYFSAKIEQTLKYPIDSENSEGLLALPEMQHLADKNVIILRAETGRELMAQTLVTRGALVQHIECYRRMPLEENIAEKLSLAKRVGIDTIVVTSGEILDLLEAYTAEEDKDWLHSCRLIVVSDRIAQTAENLGWSAEKIIVSLRADNQSLFEIISQQVQ